MMKLQDLVNYAKCPMLFGHDIDETKDFDPLDKFAYSLIREFMFIAIRRRGRAPIRYIRSRILRELERIHKKQLHRGKTIEGRLAPYIEKLTHFYLDIYDNNSYIEILDADYPLEFYVDTELIEAVVPYILFNPFNKRVAIFTLSHQINTKEDLLRSNEILGLTYGINQIIPVRHIFNYNVLTGAVVSTPISADYISKAEKVLVSIVRSVRAGFRYYGCSGNCILQTCK